MPCGHQIPAAVVAGTHQITSCLLCRAGHSHCGDLPKMQQPSQMGGIASIGFDPVPGRADQLRRSGHLTSDPGRTQGSGQPEPGRAGLIGHRHRARESTEPRHDLPVIGSQSSLEHLTGVCVQSTSEDRTCMHIQPNTRTLKFHWGLPHLVALPARTHFLSATHVHM